MALQTFSDRIGGVLALLPLKRFRGRAPTVSVVRLEGVIGRLGPVRHGLTLAGVERSLERAFAKKRQAAVAISINSPGGAPVQAALIARRIRRLAEEKEVPVYAFAEDVAASGGYWLALAGDEIYADEASIVGSIGVISAGFGFDRLIERHGIERRVHTAGAHKSMLDPFRTEDPEDIERLTEIQTELHGVFKDFVRARRGDKLKGDDTLLFEGDIWTGRQALALGLIDGIGDTGTVLREKFGDKVRLRQVGGRPSILRRLGLGGSESRAAETAASLIALIDDWAAWKRFGL